MPPAIRNFFDGLSIATAVLVVFGVWLQIYLIAAFLFGADSLDAHTDVGYVVHGLETLTLVGALLAWRGRQEVLLALALVVVGTGQIELSSAEEWVGGLHGLFALVVLVVGVFYAKRGVERMRTA